MDYIRCLGTAFPTVSAVCFGDPYIYSNLQWEEGDPLPPQAVLDAKILELTKLKRIQELSDSCQLDIVSGFDSAALGTLHRYDAYEVDQLNLIGATHTTAPTPTNPDGTSIGYATRPYNGEQLDPKVYKVHTHLQLRTVLQDGADYKLERLQKFNDKRNLVNEATSLAEVNAITWNSIP